MMGKKIIGCLTVVLAVALALCTALSAINEKTSRPVVRITSPVMSEERLLGVPEQAVFQDEQGKSCVFVTAKVQGLWEDEYEVHKRLITVEMTEAGICYLYGIEEGLTAKVVIETSAALSEGVKVSVTED